MVTRFLLYLLSTVLGFRETRVHCGYFLEMASDWHCVINVSISKICHSGRDITWQQSSSKNVQDHSPPPHVPPSGKWKHREARMTGKSFPLKTDYCPSDDQCMVKIDELYYNHEYLPKPCSSTPRLPIDLYKVEPVSRPERKMGPAMLEIEDLVWHENMEELEPAVE